MSDFLYTIGRLNFVSLIDIAIVTIIFYWLLAFVEGTRAVSLLRGVILLIIAATLVADYSPLPMLNWMIRQSLPALVLVIPIVFQPELRRAIEQLGRTGSLPHWAPGSTGNGSVTVIERVAEAAARLSERRHGGLIVIERATGLHEFADSGVAMDSQITVELLLTIFFPNSPLHDGAVIVKGDKIVAAGCVLPLAEAGTHEAELGLRHQAACGLAQQTDAVVVVVSEETSTISLAHNGRMVRHLSEDKLRKVLAAIFRLQLAQPPPLPVLHPRSSQAEGA